MSNRKLKNPVTMYQGTRIRHIEERDCWQVDYTALGNRDRKRFKTLAAAKTWVDQKQIETQNKGRDAFGMADRDRLDVADARRKLGDGITLSSVFDFWFLHHPEGQTASVETVVDKFLDAPGRRGRKSVTRRDATTKGHAWRLRAFCKVFGGREAHEVTRTELEQWLDTNDWQGINRRHYLAAVRAMFAFAVRKKYVAINPADEIESPTVSTPEPQIMTTAQVEKYLTAIEATCPELLAREAIAFFCGLRPEELSRLDWRNVSIENKLITVSGDVAKVQGHRRNVVMSDNLLTWLSPYVQHEGAVWPYASQTTLVRKRRSAREAAGIDVPDNAGRHAFASYHLAAHENAPQTAEAMGHADIKLLRNTYRNIVASDGSNITKAAGVAYFKIMPNRDEKVVQFRASATA